MGEEGRSVYIYDLDQTVVTTTDVHDWLSHLGHVEAVTLRYNPATNSTAFRVVMGSAEQANIALNHLDGSMFKNSVARIESTVYSKSVKAPAAGAPNGPILMSPSGVAVVAQDEKPFISEALPHNHLLPTEYQLVSPLAEWADRLLKAENGELSKQDDAVTATEGTSSSTKSVLASLKALQETQARLASLVSERDELNAQVYPKWAQQDAVVDAEKKAEEKGEEAPAGVLESTTKALAFLRGDRAARVVEASFLPSRTGVSEVGEIVLLVSRVIGPVVGATISQLGTAQVNGHDAHTLVLEMAFAEDAAALVRLGNMPSLSADSAHNKNKNPLPEVGTVLSKATTTTITRGGPAAGSAKRSTLDQLLGIDMSSAEEGANAITEYKGRLAKIQAFGPFAKPSAATQSWINREVNAYAPKRGGNLRSETDSLCDLLEF